MADLLQLLRPVSHPSVDAALAGALPTAGQGDAQRIVAQLLERERSSFTTSIIENYHRLPSGARQRIVDQAWTLQTAIRTACRKTHTQAAANATEVIGIAGLTSMAYLAPTQLRNADPPRQDAAAWCLFRLAQGCVPQATSQADNEPSEASAPLSRQAGVGNGGTLEVAAAVREAVVHYQQHESPTVLRALLILLPVMPRALHELTELFEASDHPAVEPLRQMLESCELPEARRALLAALRLSALAKAAEAGLGQAAANGQLGQALANHQVLNLPGTRRALARIETPTQLCPQPGEVQAWSDPQQQGLVRWLANLPLWRQQHIAQLAALAEALRARPRMSAVRRLIELSQDHTNHHHQNQNPGLSTDPQPPNPRETSPSDSTDPARAGLAQYAAARNADPASASAAIDALQALRYSHLQSVLTAMLNAHRPQVRQMAATRLAPGVFDKLWNHWPQTSHAQRSALGKVWLKLDEQADQRLNAKLKLGDRKPVLRALDVIRCLDQQPAFHTELMRLTQAADPSIAAAAQRTINPAQASSQAKLPATA